MNNDSLRYFVVELDENGDLIINDADSAEGCSGELVEHIGAEALTNALEQLRLGAFDFDVLEDCPDLDDRENEMRRLIMESILTLQKMYTAHRIRKEKEEVAIADQLKKQEEERLEREKEEANKKKVEIEQQELLLFQGYLDQLMTNKDNLSLIPDRGNPKEKVKGFLNRLIKSIGRKNAKTIFEAEIEIRIREVTTALGIEFDNQIGVFSYDEYIDVRNASVRSFIDFVSNNSREIIQSKSLCENSPYIDKAKEYIFVVQEYNLAVDKLVQLSQEYSNLFPNSLTIQLPLIIETVLKCDIKDIIERCNNLQIEMYGILTSIMKAKQMLLEKGINANPSLETFSQKIQNFADIFAKIKSTCEGIVNTTIQSSPQPQSSQD